MLIVQLLQNNWVSKTIQFRGFLSANAPSRAGPPPCARRARTPLVHRGLRGGSQRGCGTPRVVAGVEVAEGERACMGGAGTVLARCHLCWGWQRAPPGRGQCGGAPQEATGARELGTDQSFSGLAPGLALHALFPGFGRHPLLGGRERAVKEHADNLQSINNTSPYLHSHVSSS